MGDLTCICDLTTLFIDGGDGGVNTYLIEKARYLSRDAGIRHVIIVPGRKDATFELHGATVHTLKSPRLPWNPDHRVLTRFRAVRRILRSVAPSVVEVDCAYVLARVAVRALRERNVPVLGFYHVHLPTFITRPGLRRLGGFVSELAESGAWRYVKFCHRSCDRLIVSSQDIAARLRRCGLSRLEVAPLGVNLDLFRPRPGLRPSAGDPTVLLYVGRLSHEKNLDVLIRAFRILRSRGGRYRLVIVGQGPVGADLERLAEGDPAIAFLGPIPYGERLAEVYASADILANPSPNETFNLSILEGLASGIPVVAAAQGGPVDLVTADLGMLADPDCPTDLADKIEQVDRNRTAYVDVRSHVARTYGWSQAFDRLMEIYRQAILSRQAGPARSTASEGRAPSPGPTVPRPRGRSEATSSHAAGRGREKVRSGV